MKQDNNNEKSSILRRRDPKYKYLDDDSPLTIMDRVRGRWFFTLFRYLRWKNNRDIEKLCKKHSVYLKFPGDIVCEVISKKDGSVATIIYDEEITGSKRLRPIAEELEYLMYEVPTSQFYELAWIFGRGHVEYNDCNITVIRDKMYNIYAEYQWDVTTKKYSDIEKSIEEY